MVIMLIRHTMEMILCFAIELTFRKNNGSCEIKITLKAMI